jgi:hypothetical protein
VPQNVITKLRNNIIVRTNGRSSHVGGRTGTCSKYLPEDKASVPKHVHVEILQKVKLNLTEMHLFGLRYMTLL